MIAGTVVLAGRLRRGCGVALLVMAAVATLSARAPRYSVVCDTMAGSSIQVVSDQLFGGRPLVRDDSDTALFYLQRNRNTAFPQPWRSTLSCTETGGRSLPECIDPDLWHRFITQGPHYRG
jgi:hypothetical protein